MSISSFRLQGRIGRGTRAVRLGLGDSLATAILAGGPGEASMDLQQDILISTANGMLLRVAVKDVAVLSRLAKGHRIVKLRDGDEVGTVTIVGV